MPTLAFYIDAPLQSWGVSSKFQHRETNPFPTKSAVMGLVAAALGIDKHEPNEAANLQPIADLNLTVVRLPKENDIQPQRLSDFHTVGGGYDKKASLWEKMSIPQKASGAPFGTVITHRSYLTDATFVALLDGSADLLTEIQSALLNPQWGVWFGRKHCLPASPLTPTLEKDREAAFCQLLQTLPGKEPAPIEAFEYQEEIRPGNATDGTFHQSDQPVAFGRHQGAVPEAYRARGIRQHKPTQ